MSTLAIVVGALVLSAFFSGSEIALVSANRLRVAARAKRRGLVGSLVQSLFKEPARFLTTTLVGNNIALVVYSTLMALLLAEPVHRFLANTLGITAAVLEVAALATQSAIAGFLVLLLGEILPKAIARPAATHAVFAVAVPLRVAYHVLKPLVMLTMWTARLILRMAPAGQASSTLFPRRQFELLIEEGPLDLNEEESDLLSNVLELRSKRVKESMTPRTDIIAVDESTSIEALRARCIEFGYSKIPVYRENIDTIVGVAFAHDLFRAPASLKEIIRPAKFVPEAKPSKELFEEFRATNSSIGIVIDEYGGTAGLITREDLLEELFGDIQDEFDSEDKAMRRVDATTVLASGRAEIDELNEEFDLNLPTGTYETIAGYLLERLGTIPKPDPQKAIKLGDYQFFVHQASSHRIDLIRITWPSDRPGATDTRPR